MWTKEQEQVFDEYAKAHFEETKALLKTLCEIPAPSHAEEGRAAFCKEWLEKFGAKGVFVDEAKNAVFPMQDTGKDAVLFMAHTDTVFPDVAPMQVTQANGKIYCPGVGDDTANVAIMLMAVRYFLEQGKKPKTDLIFAADSCEEGLGNLKGSRALVERYGDRLKEVVCFDLNLDQLYVKAVGSARYEITVTTNGGHSWSDFGAPSAIHEAAQLISKLCSQPMPKDQKASYNVGLISGGTSVNTIAQKAQFCYEYRSDSAEAMAVMEENFQKAIAVKKDGVSVAVKTLGVRPGNGESKDKRAQEDLIARADKTIERVTGKKPAHLAGSTDCNIPLSLGIPSVCMGLIMGNGAHTREEYIYADSLMLGLKTALRFLSWYFEL